MNGTNRNVFRATMAAAVLVAFGILLLVNWLGSRHYKRFDWTRSGLYSLSDKTKAVLKDVKAPVTITVFMIEGTQLYPEVQELLKRYKAASVLLTVETIDPTRNKARAEALVKEFGVSGFSVVFKSGDKKKYVSIDQLAEMDFSRARMGGEPSLKSFKGEQEFTSAILAVTQQKSPKVVFTKGHGEHSIESQARDGFFAIAETLRRDNCTVEEWASLGSPAVPENTDLLLVAGPKSSFTEPEVAAVKTYLENGGRAVFFLDVELAPGRSDQLLTLGLENMLLDFGVKLGKNIVVEPKNRVPMMGADTFFATSFRSHPITKLLEGNAVVFALARSVGMTESVPAGYLANILVETSPEAWGEVDLANLENISQGETDQKGPLPVAVAVESNKEGGPKSRLVVFGDSDFAANGGFANAGNSYLVEGALNWSLAREAMVAIPPKSTDQISVTLSRADITRMALFAIFVLPAAALALGLAIYFKRRR